MFDERELNKWLFISAHTKTAYLHILFWNLGLESGIFVKKHGIRNLVQKFSWCQIPHTTPDVSGYVLSHLLTSADILYT